MGLLKPGVVHAKLLIVLLAAAVLVGCGGDDDPDRVPADEPPVEQPAPEQPAGPGPARMPRQALATIEEQGANAATGLEGVSDMDLLPGEEGAQLIIERGHLNEDAFCAADEVATQAEAGPEAEEAFERGWKRNAHEGVEDMGATMYQALSFGCLDF